MCQNLNTEPVLGIFAGYTLNHTVIAQADLAPYVQDTMDELEYILGDTTTTWGAKRAANGHAAPYTLHYVEVGNEDFFDSTGSYNSYRFPMYYDAIKAKYPSLNLIATTGISSRTPDMVDEHFYSDEPTLLNLSHRYDSYNRSGPKIFVGEYAARGGSNPGNKANLGGAIGEAAFMTGMERNSDIVWGASYAPLFANDNFHSWDPDLIYFNAAASYATPNYYVQQMFSTHRGDVTLPTSSANGDGSLYFVSSKVQSNGTVYIKVVNTGSATETTTINLQGATSLNSAGTATVLTSANLTDANSFSQPNNVVPVTNNLTGLAASFSYNFPPNSVTILTLNNVVATPTNVVQNSNWKFDESTGTTASDASGNNNTGTLQSAATWTSGKVGAHAVSFNGTANSYVDVPNAVVDTSQSYSVAAWVKLNNLNGYQTAVSIDGNSVSNFFLQLRGDTGKFAFTTLASDTPQAGIVASASTAPSVGTWYHLVGVYDGTYLRLYLNGVLQDTKSVSTPWQATGHTAIGRAKYNGANTDFFNGQVDDVHFYAGALNTQQILALASTPTAYLQFDEGTGTTAGDFSGNNNTGTLQSGATWTSGKVGAHAVSFDGTANGYVDVPNAVVNTSQSYSVAAWVKLNNLNGYQTAVSIDGNSVSGFYLQLRGDTGKFAFTTLASDAPQAGVIASASAAPSVGTWYHLVGVYDATNHQIKFYLNGALQSTQSYTTAWQAAGHTAVGRAKYNGNNVDFVNGQVDDVHLYNRVLSDQEIASLAKG
jgi:hypothetical protein